MAVNDPPQLGGQQRKVTRGGRDEVVNLDINKERNRRYRKPLAT